jgi:hypothetical protein
MISTREQAAEACTQLSAVAARLIDQLNALSPQQAEVTHFYKGVVVRTGVHLKDAALVLGTNRDPHISTAFSIFRIVLDDLLRSCYVYASPDRQEALDDLTARARKDFYGTWREAARLNRMLNLGGDMTDEVIDAELEKFITSDEGARYVTKNKKGETVLRDVVNARKMVGTIETHPKVAHYARGYVLFKQMSQYIHYSMLTYEMDRSPARAKEIPFIDEVIFLAYHLLKLAQEVISEPNPQLTWPAGPMDVSFDRPKYLVP